MIRIQRQSKDEAAPEAPTQPKPQAEHPKPKIILKKRDAAAAAPPASVPAKPGASGTPIATKMPPKKRVSSNTALLVQMGIVGFLLLAAGAILLKVAHSRKVRLQKEAIALKQEMDTAIQNFSQVEATASVVASLAMSARPCAQSVSAAVMAVLGESVEKEAPGVQTASTSVPAAPAPARATPQPPAPTPALTPLPSSQREGLREQDAAGREAPFGIESLAEVRMRHAAPGPRAPAAVENVRPGELPPPGEPPRAASRPVRVAAPDDPKIRVLAIEVIAQVQRMQENAALAQEVTGTARQVRDKALAMATADSVKRDAFEILSCLTTVQQVKKESEELLVSARKGVEDVLAEKSRIEAERREQARIAEERRREEERKERIRREVQSAHDIVKKAEPLIPKFQYSEASQMLQDHYQTLTADEAKNVMKDPMDRYARLVVIKKHLVDHLNSDPFRWGWTLTPSPVDILGADENEIRIKGKATLWAETAMPQILKILNHYMVKEMIKAGQYGDYLLSAAVFCYENNEMAASSEYARQAVGEDPALSDDAARLMPSKGAP